MWIFCPFLPYTPQMVTLLMMEAPSKITVVVIIKVNIDLYNLGEKRRHKKRLIGHSKIFIKIITMITYKHEYRY